MNEPAMIPAEIHHPELNVEREEITVVNRCPVANRDAAPAESAPAAMISDSAPNSSCRSAQPEV